MIYANVFGKIAGVIFYVCVAISIGLLAFGGIRRLVEIIKTRKKLKKDKERLENEPKAKEVTHKDKE